MNYFDHKFCCPTALAVAGLLGCAEVHAAPVLAANYKPRVIATQDGEVYDRSSMVRFLMYSSDYDVVGIVANNSIFQKKGHGRAWIDHEIDLYTQVYRNFKQHHPDYPTPEYLRSVIRIGNENPADLQTGPGWTPVAPANMATKDTPGSDLIIQTLLDDDPRPVHVPSWGGANTTAYALWKIKTTMPDKWERAASHIGIYAICYNLTNKAQDGGIPWIIKNLPEVNIYQSAAWSRTWNYSSVGKGSYSPTEVQAYMTGEWLTNHVKSGHGPLGEYYPQKYVSEGDTPWFLPLINNGLNQHLDYTFGGWGGRARYQSGNHMVDDADDAPAHPEHKAFYRWIPAAQNDFAVRIDWCVATNYAGANHPPVARFVGSLQRDVSPGQTVTLDASPCSDPDGNALTFNWWQYYETDSAATKVSIANSNSMTGASFVVPNEPGKLVHIILQVTDNGTPPLTGYQRIICNIQ